MFSLEIAVSEKDQLEEEGVVVRLRKVPSLPLDGIITFKDTNAMT